MNHLDFLEALDRHTRAAPSGEVATGYDMHQLAWQEGQQRPASCLQQAGRANLTTSATSNPAPP